MLFTTPAVGGTNSAIAPDVPTYDGGLLQYNLKLTKELTASAPFYAGSTVTFSLTPHNDGPAVALAGWTVTDILPAGLSPVTPTAISGTGYTCVQATLTCTSDSELAPNTDGGVITVTATINAGFTGTLHNVAYVAPVGSDTLPELNPLVVPTTTTDTSTTPTDNDSQASLTVASLVSIGDYVWFDNNRDGIQGDPAVEKPVEGVVVNLYAADGFTLVATTTTDDKGFYSFVDLVPDATYVVEFVKPAGTTFTQQTAGSDRAVDSNPDPATGRVTITAPASGVNSPTTPDDPTIDAGLITYNLKLTKALTSHGPYYVGATVTYTLTPHNDGPATAVPGWSVTDVLPTQLTATEMTGTGYTCDLPSLTCTSPTELAPGQDGPVITLTATVNQLFIGQLKNVAYVAPNPEDGVPETNPLGTPPDNTTETKTSPTDNDDEQVIDVVSLVSIGDYVWMDNNRDGQQGPAATEPPVPGVKVELFDSSGTSIGTTTTDANGFYSFVDLVPGASYKLVFTRPDGFSWTARNLGAKATDSDVDANGEVTFTAPASGVNSPTTPDDPTIDAGLVQYNLTLDKKLTSAGPYYPGSTATFQLTPHNDGPSDAIGGWSVTDVLPKGLTATAISGAGYTCTLSTLTCVNAASLAGGADGGPITVTATVDALFAGVLHNVAYVAPNPSDSVAETNPLGTPPTSSTQTSLTPTDNDSEAEITVSVPPTTSTTLVSPGTGSIATTTTVTPTTGPLPSTGSNVGTPLLAGVVLSLGGLGLLLISRRRRRHARA